MKKWIVYVSTFPPRECGIATFTQDLMNSFDEMYNPREEAKVVAMNINSTSKYTYDKRKVIFQIPQPDENSYIAAAQYLNGLEHVSLVHVQHEFGIFGGENGSHIILMLRELKKPVVITFHTVLPGPNPKLRETVVEINSHVGTIVVMTETSKKILIEHYGIDAAKIKVIPHGIHQINFTDGKEAKSDLGLSKKTVISTFGLLSPGKGIEYGIEAMSKVVKKFPDAVYLIIGATHPVVLKNDGEKYRNSLVEKVHSLGLEHNVLFYDRYLKLSELLHFLDATDIYTALSQDPNQAVSGTLSYALGSGKPVISTAFAQAKEDVKPEVGILVDFKNVNEISNAMIQLLGDAELRTKMGKSAYFRTRSHTWSNVILAHMAEYIRVVPILGEIEKNLPRVNISHVLRMTDDFGMFQFAKLETPDPASGYTTDDNARALIAMVKCYEKFGGKKPLSLIKTYIDYLEFVERDGGGFHNYVEVTKNIPEEQHTRENLETMSSRTMFALAKTATAVNLPKELREKAAAIFRRHLHVGRKMLSPRSIAYLVKALTTWMSIDNSEEVKKYVIELADKLVQIYDKNRTENWRWFEDILAYSNAVMPDALMDAYVAIKNEKYLSVARESLDFLVGYSFEDNVCVPIGQNGWLQKGGVKQRYDQQPEEVAILVFALKSAYLITGDENYNKKRRDAFNWFLGNNTLHQVVYNQATGGCYDGVGEKEINLNQGAESTVMYLLARLSFE